MANFNENKNRNKARAWTIIVHVVLLLWFALTGLKYQDPPPEEGIAINFGYEEDGSGANTQAAPSTPVQNIPEPVAPTPAAQEEVVTQDVEDAPVIEQTEEPVKEKPKEPEVKKPEEPVKETTPDPEPEPDPQPTEEELEQQRKQDRLNKLFSTSKNGSGSGEGETTGGGDQGDPNGDSLSPNRTGNGGIGGNGKYWMSGKPIRLPEPKKGCNYEGVVVIKIAVDATGRVFEAELAPKNQVPSGLTPSNFGANTCLVNKAKVAAKSSIWSPDGDNQRRVGFIVYRFDLQ
jgi:protein TonB